MLYFSGAAVAAKGFANLLDLATHGMVLLEQPAPYGAIRISVSADHFNSEIAV